MTKVDAISEGVEQRSADGKNNESMPSTESMGALKGMMEKVGQQFGGARRGGARRGGARRGGARRGGAKKSSLSRRRSYRRRVKSSPCRKKGPAVCRSMKNCKFVSKKRRYCRKGKNTRRRSRGGARRGGARRGGARRMEGGARRMEGGSRRRSRRSRRR